MNSIVYTLVLCSLGLVLAAACTPEVHQARGTTGDTNVGIQAQEATWDINAGVVDCVGVGPRQCRQVRESGTTDWEFFYDSIVGFDPDPNCRYTVRLNQIPVDNPPADGSSIRYTLISVLNTDCS